MPRFRNLNKFLRVDKNGQEIPDWKYKILERKKQKWIVSEKKEQEKGIIYLKKDEERSGEDNKKEKKVKKLINHYEEIISKNKN